MALLHRGTCILLCHLTPQLCWGLKWLSRRLRDTLGDMRFRKGAHTVYKTEYHIVWIPRYRRKIFVKGVKEYTDTLLTNLPNLHSDIEVVKVNVRLDHVHLVLVIPPRVAVADVVQFIKSQSGKLLYRKCTGVEAASGLGDTVSPRSDSMKRKSSRM